MHVKLVLTGYLSWYTPGHVSELELTVPPGTTIRQAFELAHLPFPEVAFAVINDRHCDMSTPVQDGQCITLIPPIAGG